MTRSDRTTAAWSLDTPSEGSVTGAHAGLQFLLANADAAISQASMVADAARGEIPSTGNLPDFPPDRTRSGEIASAVVNLLPPIKPAPRRATLHPLQEWEGYVVEIGDEDFTARLVDLTANHSYESEEATIPFAEISERDAAGMTAGSIFRWVIGYERSAEGTRKRVSQIVFRDLPRMTESDLVTGKAWAEKIAAALNP